MTAIFSARRTFTLRLLLGVLVLAATAAPLLAQEIGGGPSVPRERIEQDQGPSQLGDRFKAGALSLILPGSGQYYNRQYGKARIYGVAELAVWMGYFVFDHQAEGYTQDYIDYSGIYAGVSGDHNERYWRMVGSYMSSEEYNTERLIETRATGEDPKLIAPGDAWAWRNETFLANYQSLRSDTNRTEQRRDFMILFAIVNRAIAVYDAVRNAGPREHMLEVAGFGVDLRQSYRQGNRTAQCVFSKSF